MFSQEYLNNPGDLMKVPGNIDILPKKDRIEELAADCFDYYEGTLDGDIVEFNHRKFAELIIKECIGLLPETCQSDNGCHASWTVQEHFGIKE